MPPGGTGAGCKIARGNSEDVLGIAFNLRLIDKHEACPIKNKPRHAEHGMSEESATLNCRACGFTGSFKTFSAREMLSGWRHTFQYGECPRCASLQICEIPSNLSEYYPADYYSLQPPPVRAKTPTPVRLAFARGLLNPQSVLSDFVAKAMSGKSPFFYWSRLARCDLNSRILDVGCGTGGLLRRMQRYGFNDLSGFDPYTPTEIEEPGFQIRRAELAQARGPYDLIMMHHVLEHLADPLKALSEAKTKLSPKGKILVRIPVAASESWRAYRQDWFNLDPPRHLLVPSTEGMGKLAERSGLRIAHTSYDGTEMNWLMSEHYKRDVSYSAKPQDSYWRRRRFRKLAKLANRQAKGDQGVFLLEAK